MPHHLTTSYPELDQAVILLNGIPFMVAEIETPRSAGEFLDDYSREYDIDRESLSLVWMSKARIISRYERTPKCPTT